MNNEQFERTIGLLGGKGFEKLSSSTVAVFGLGGVGGTALEALARTGVQSFVIADFDVVNLSNLNRQILYTRKDIGKTKVCAAEERLRAINDKMSLISIGKKINSETISSLEGIKVDYIVDAIDEYPVLVNWLVEMVAAFLGKKYPRSLKNFQATMSEREERMKSLKKTETEPLIRTSM